MPTTQTDPIRQPPMDLPSHGAAASGRLVWIRLLLIAVTLVAFARLCTADFSNLDDPQTTYANPHLTPPSLQNIAWFWMHPYMDIYAPLPFTLWGALLNVSKVPTPNEIGVFCNSFIFHTVNVLLHIGSVLVLFELLRRLTKHAGASAIGALLFALHPVQVEAVAWISGAKDLLYGLFALVALWQYVLYVQGTQASGRETATRDGPVAHYIAALAALLAALLSKPTAVVTPVLALVIDYWLLRRDIKKALWSLWPWFALAVPFALIAKFAQPAAEVYASPLWSRPLIALDALAFYLYKLGYPAHLAVDYGRKPQVLLHSTWIYWTWIIPLAVVLAIWLLRKKAKWLVPAGLLSLVCLLPVLGLTPFDYQYYSTVTDHYLYLAMIGPALVVAMLMTRYWRSWGVATAGVVLVALGVRTAAQTAYWQNSIALFEHNLAVNPDSGFSHERLAHYYNERGVQWARMVDQANRQIQDLQRQGRSRQARQVAETREQYKRLAMADWEKSEAQYQIALKWNPLWPTIRMNYAGVLANLRRFDQAMAQLKQVIDNQPSLPPARRGGFETLWFHAGMRAYERGDDKKAAEDFRRALQQNPGDAVSTRAWQIVTGKMQRE